LVVGVKEPYLHLEVEDDDQAFYYFVTVSDSFHNESEPSTPAYFYHSQTIK
jgi:hypothetical protein